MSCQEKKEPEPERRTIITWECESERPWIKQVNEIQIRFVVGVGFVGFHTSILLS